LLKDKYFSWCIGATEGQNAGGYTVYYMWLPEKKDAAEPFALEGGLVTKFDPAVHITKSKAVAENAALNDGVDDEDDSVADEFANAPTDSPFDDTDELDDSELFDMGDDD
jgi:hypothetical protein